MFSFKKMYNTYHSSQMFRSLRKLSSKNEGIFILQTFPMPVYLKNVTSNDYQKNHAEKQFLFTFKTIKYRFLLHTFSGLGVTIPIDKKGTTQH